MVARERARSFKNNMKVKRKQYGLKHRFTGTIHTGMGNILISMYTKISHRDPNFRLWDRSQLVVILSWEK